MKIHSNHPGGGPPSTPPGKGPEKAHGHQQQEEFDAVFEQIQHQQEKERQIQREEQEKRVLERENKERQFKEQDLKEKDLHSKENGETHRYGSEQARNKAFSYRTQQKPEAEAEVEVEPETGGENEQQEAQTLTAEDKPVTTGQNPAAQTYRKENQKRVIPEQADSQRDTNQLEGEGLHLGEEQGLHLGQQQAQAPSQGPGKRIGQTVEHGAKGEAKGKMNDTNIGKSPLKNIPVEAKPAGEGQKTANAGKPPGTLTDELQEGNQQSAPDENAGFQRAMSKLQEKLLGNDALQEPEHSETLHAEKFIKGLEEQKGDKTQFPLGQTLPLSTYLEAVGQPPQIQPPPVQGGLNIAHIEKLVDQMLVGVNSTGDPEIKMSLHLPELGQLEVKITRADSGLSIQLNTQTEKAGVQLGQNMTVLQSTLAQRGLLINNIELLIQSQPVPLSEFIEAVRPAFEAKTVRKDSTSRASRENKKDRPETGPTPKGR